jgi:hypothetical protein
MAELNGSTDGGRRGSRSTDDLVVIDVHSGKVVVEVQDRQALAGQRAPLKLKLNQNEARLLAAILARNAEAAGDN